MFLSLRALNRLPLALLICLVVVPRTSAQGSGSRGGVVGTANTSSFPVLDRKTASECIMLEGSAEVRVRPTEIRVVLAVTNEAKTAKECQDGVEHVVDELKRQWSKMPTPPKSVVVDFIAVLPRYEWKFEKTDGTEVAIERRVGYRMQTNVHLAVQEESIAQAAIAKAFAQGVTDIIAIDYWSADVDDAKVQARQQAVAAARRKAEGLLFSLLDEPLRVINVQEQTRVLSPEKLYDSFVSRYAETVERPPRRNVPLVRAYRPRNTYYRGPQVEVDTQAHELPMHPEISVISRVRLYFESPAAKNASQHQQLEKKKVPTSASRG